MQMAKLVDPPTTMSKRIAIGPKSQIHPFGTCMLSAFESVLGRTIACGPCLVWLTADKWRHQKYFKGLISSIEKSNTLVEQASHPTLQDMETVSIKPYKMDMWSNAKTSE